MIELGRVTVFEYDLRDALWALEKIRAEHPDCEGTPAHIDLFSENYITGRKSHISVTHNAVDRTYQIVERKP